MSLIIYVCCIVSIMFSFCKMFHLSTVFHMPDVSMLSWCTEASACASDLIVSTDKTKQGMWMVQ